MMVYNAAKDGFHGWKLPAILLLLFACPFFIRFAFKLLQGKLSYSDLAGALVSFVTAIAVLQFSLGTFKQAALFLESGEFSISTGIVQNARNVEKITPTVAYFDLNGQTFTFYNYDFFGRFSNNCWRKCIVTQNKPLRIYHNKNMILKIELLTGDINPRTN